MIHSRFGVWGFGVQGVQDKGSGGRIQGLWGLDFVVFGALGFELHAWGRKESKTKFSRVGRGYCKYTRVTTRGYWDHLPKSGRLSVL